ncbi:ExbD/TolR family protein [Asticcacaulis sp. W401b]|uniref:ExbD/TolR family protein n=1 Tax=Asticcacaulis sp. W401b TaxID=3388666 RepID=UPI0039708C43
MAMGNAGTGGGRRRGRRRARRGALAEINVTPMVDVMLVLLIIFMISAPLLTSGIKIELPKTEAAALKDEGDPITVSIQRDGALYVMDDAATFDQLTPRLMAMTDNDTSKPIYVRAEGAAPYETVAKVMARLSTSGFTKINLLTENLGKTQKPATSGEAAP